MLLRTLLSPSPLPFLPQMTPSPRTRGFWSPKVLGDPLLRFLAGLRLQTLHKRADDAKGIKNPLGIFFSEFSLPSSPGWHSSFSLGRKSCFPPPPPSRGQSTQRVGLRKDSVFSSFFHPSIKLASWTGLLPLSVQAVPPFLSLLCPSPSLSPTKCALFSPRTLWLFFSSLGILAGRVRGSRLRGQQAWAADSYHFKMRFSPYPPPPPFFLFQKNLSFGSFLSLQCWGRQRGGFWMGKQGGPYLTSGLKHSFRKGKGRRGTRSKAFQSSE